MIRRGDVVHGEKTWSSLVIVLDTDPRQQHKKKLQSAFKI